MRTRSAILIAFATVGLGLCAGGPLGCGRGAKTALILRAPGTGPRAPALEFTDLTSGREEALSSFRGSLVMVNFWASWCVPCREEAPALAAVARRFAGGGKVVGMSVDEKPSAAREFIRKFALGYPNGMASARGEADFGVHGAIPVTVLVDSDGRIAGRDVGAEPYWVFEREVDALTGKQSGNGAMVMLPGILGRLRGLGALYRVDLTPPADPHPRVLSQTVGRTMLAPDSFDDQDVREDYREAIALQGILDQFPCFCRCDLALGHRSLYDCFTDEHAASCDTCQREVRFIYAQHAAGVALAEILVEVDRKEWRRWR